MPRAPAVVAPLLSVCWLFFGFPLAFLPLLPSDFPSAFRPLTCGFPHRWLPFGLFMASLWLPFGFPLASGFGSLWGFLWGSFPFAFLWLPLGSPLASLWLSVLAFLWCSFGCPFVSPLGVIWASFPLAFLWLSVGFPLAFHWLPFGFCLAIDTTFLELPFDLSFTKKSSCQH